MYFYKGASYTFKYLITQLFYANQTISRFWYIKLKRNSYPRMIEVEPTTYCYAKCIVCEHTYWNENPQHLGYEDFKSIIDQFPKLRWIGLTGIGSSFLNPDYLRMIELVKGRDIYTVVIDTLSLIDVKQLRRLVELEVDRLVISMMGAKAETYNRHHVGCKFEQVIDNINSLVGFKKEMKKVYPEITFHFIATKENLGELLEFLYLIRRIIRDENVAVLISPILSPFKQIRYLYTEIPDSLLKDAQKMARSLKIKLDINRSVFKENVNRCIEWSQPFIFSDGSVIPCCATNEANQRRLQVENRLGDVLETPFVQIWWGERYNELRDSVRRGKLPRFCATCALYEEKVKIES